MKGRNEAYEVLYELLVGGADVLPLIAARTEDAVGVERVGAAAGDVGYGSGRVVDLVELDGTIRGEEQSGMFPP